MTHFHGKRILVTGACGTIGQELVRELLSNPVNGPSEVVGLDHNEAGLFFMDQEYLADDRAQFFVADIRDRDEMCRRMSGIDIVFHAAALKHVILTERSPDQAVQTNILGVQNLIAAAKENQIDMVLFMSSDKAVNPTSVMGTSKLMGERLMTAANSDRRGEGPVFASTRFGNVLGSSGSVVPIFHRQIAQGGPVTLTDPDMTRFVMSISEAVHLVLDSAKLARGGEVLITKMPVIRIQDLAEVMIQELGPRYGYEPASIEIQQIGLKPGEKLYEELMSAEETRRSLELSSYFSVLPAFRGIYNAISYDYPELISRDVKRSYVSNEVEPISQMEILTILADNELLAESAPSVARRYWPGDKEEQQR